MLFVNDKILAPTLCGTHSPSSRQPPFMTSRPEDVLNTPGITATYVFR